MSLTKYSLAAVAAAAMTAACSQHMPSPPTSPSIPNSSPEVPARPSSNPTSPSTEPQPSPIPPKP